MPVFVIALHYFKGPRRCSNFINKSYLLDFELGFDSYINLSFESLQSFISIKIDIVNYNVHDSNKHFIINYNWRCLKIVNFNC